MLLRLVATLAVTLACAHVHAAPPPAASISAPAGKGVVAADHFIASEAGAAMLRKGGNAVDAAVATSFTLSVVRPFSCGIGGGGFMVLRIQKNGARVERAINYREWGPAAASDTMYEKGDPLDSTIGGRAVAVPGTVAGLLHALDHYGTLDRSAVLAPAIAAARTGFRADAAYVRAASDIADKFRSHPAYEQRFPFVWERLLLRGRVKEGDLITLPEQAEALELIARDGAKAFYEGPIAAAIVAAVKADKGVVNTADLKAYLARGVVESDPLAFTFAGRRFLTMPPPSSGGVALAESLGILQRTTALDAAAKDRWAEWNSLMIGAMQHAMADRATYIWDPAGGAPGGAPPIQRLLSTDTLTALAARTRLGRAPGPQHWGLRALDAARKDDPAQPPDDHGTSHLSVIDARGNAVACTETINLEFGSLVAPSQFGFCLNNEMDDFTPRRGAANAFGLVQSDQNLPAPRRRPLSSMSPTIVVDDKQRVEAVAGASGGPRIITATYQTLLRALVRKSTAAEAVGAARWHHQWTPNLLEMEEGFTDLWNGLAMDPWMRKQGHQVVPPKSRAAVQLILRRPDGSLDAASDGRKGGAPAVE